MTTLCPCCGKEMSEPRAPIEALASVPLPRHERLIVGILASAYPRRVSIDSVIDRLYAGEWDGGPINPRQTVSVRVSRLRKSLPQYGWTIPTAQSGPGSHGFYRLEPVE